MKVNTVVYNKTAIEDSKEEDVSVQNKESLCCSGRYLLYLPQPAGPQLKMNMSDQLFMHRCLHLHKSVCMCVHCVFTHLSTIQLTMQDTD